MFFLKVATSVYNGLKLDLCQMVVAQNVKAYVTEKCQKIKRHRRKMIEIYDELMYGLVELMDIIKLWSKL